MFQELKLYALALIDLAWIFLFTLSDIDPQLRSAGLLIGLCVGLFTLWKLGMDIMIKQEDRKIKKIELKLKQKELEDRIRKDYE